MNPTNRIERWQKARQDKSVNLTIGSPTEPTEDEAFLTLTLINHKGLHHQFQLTHTLKGLLNREYKYGEWFSTDSQGRKTGVSIEWRSRDKVLTKTSDAKLHELRQQMTQMIEEDPSITRQDIWHGDSGAGMMRDYG